MGLLFTAEWFWLAGVGVERGWVVGSLGIFKGDKKLEPCYPRFRGLPGVDDETIKKSCDPDGLGCVGGGSKPSDCSLAQGDGVGL